MPVVASDVELGVASLENQERILENILIVLGDGGYRKMSGSEEVGKLIGEVSPGVYNVLDLYNLDLNTNRVHMWDRLLCQSYMKLNPDPCFHPCYGIYLLIYLPLTDP